MESIYLETTVVGHIAGRLHPDPIVLARQTSTRRWWQTALQRYRIFASTLVVDECSAGDSEAGRERLALLDGIDLFAIDDETGRLADRLIVAKAVPDTEPRDAYCCGRCQWRRLFGNLELQAYNESGDHPLD